MNEMQHEPGVVGFYGALKGYNGVPNEDLYRKQGLLLQSSMPLLQPT